MKKKLGFTLIELLVVISIISLLATIVFVSINEQRKKARDAKRIADIQQINKAIQMYITDNGHPPYLGGNCSADKPDNGCYADTVGHYLTELQQELRPYITIPQDPCGQACNVGDDRASYRYVAPGGVAAWCEGVSCGSTTSELDQMYLIWAVVLETNIQGGRINNALPSFSF